ncbi:hypothetical protein [Prosthecobacter sp.]|uniref:hypothetical protein n=1 Tax=Prosthecobacter sp. TaxID=1965333 RepID=UPI0037851F2F
MMHSIGRYSQQMDFHRSILEYRFDETLKAGLAGRLPFEKEESHFAPEPSVACGIRADDTGDEFGVIYLQRSERLLVFAAAHAERASAAAVFKSAFPELSAHEIPATFKGGPLVDSPAPMNLPPPALEIPSALWRFELPGMILFFVVVIGSQYLAHAFQEPVMQWLGLHGGSPGDEPPWYFITRDFAEGICSAGALLLCVLVAVVAWRWWPSYAVMMVWMPLMWHGGNIGRSWIIYQACPGLLDGQRITTRWLTSQSYTYDHDIAGAKTLGSVSGFLLAIVLSLVSYHVRRRLARRSARREMEGSAL